MKIKKRWVSWEEFEKIQGGDWTPEDHTHEKADITDWLHAVSHESGGGDAIDALTFSNTGLRILDLGADHYLTIRPGTDLSVSRILTLTTGDAARTITLSGNPTLADWFDQAVKQASHPHFASVTVGNEGLHVLDTNASHDLIIKPGSDLTADRILTLTTGDAARTITLSGNPTLADWFDQAVKQASNPTFATVKLTGLTDGYVPYHVADATGLANSPIINFGGNIGINVADPDEQLEVNGNIKADTFLLAAGVTPNLGWLSDVTLSTLEEGETIAYDQGSGKWIDAWGVEYDNPRLIWKMYTDFFSVGTASNDPWVGAVLIDGTMVARAGETNHPGQVRLNSGGSAQSGYRWMTATDCILLSGAESSEFVFKSPISLSNVRTRLGFQDSLTDTAPTDGMYIDINGTTLKGITRNNGSETVTGTTYTISTTTWYRVKMALSTDEATATFWLYNAAGTLLWTNTTTTNIPTGAGRTLGHGVVAWIGVAGGQVLIDLDMMIASQAGYIVR